MKKHIVYGGNIMEIKLKEEDKKLLNLIQEEDACIPRVTKLAHQLGLPTSTINTKIEKFKKLGIIKGFSAVLDPEKLGLGFVAFNLSHSKLTPKFNPDTIAKKLAAIPEVEEVFFITGEWDYIAKLRVRDKNEYVKVISEVAHCVERGLGIIAPKCFKEAHKILVR
jgi:Lrp/AsnC family leucine-responsive transcriptional regulator